jgi:hypothetical protein
MNAARCGLLAKTFHDVLTDDAGHRDGSCFGVLVRSVNPIMNLQEQADRNAD